MILFRPRERILSSWSPNLTIESVPEVKLILPIKPFQEAKPIAPIRALPTDR